MVRFFLVIIGLLFAINSYAQNFGASFTTTLDRYDIAEGEKFKIKLELQNAESYSPPDISKFPASVKVISQSQSQSFAYVNGASTKVRTWVYDVSAEKSGSFNIPKISIQTDAGTLYSNELGINIKPTSDIPNVTDEKDIFIDAKVDKLSTYIDEPIIYQTKVYHLAEVESAELVKPKSKGAVIEQISDPKTGTKNINGVEYNTIEVNYLATPVNSGKVKITPSILRGKSYKEVSEKQDEKAQFDNFFDPFSLLNGDKVNKTKKLVSFTVASNTVELDVKPADESVSPWLALYDFDISTESEINNTGFIAKLGEPITLKVTLTGIGKSGDLLPDIEKYIKAENFKIYSDKAVSSRQTLASGNSFAEKIKGIKSQNFTFIPQKAGKVKFPEIKIKFWNLRTGKAEEAVMAAKEFYVTSDQSNKVSEQTYEDNSEVVSATQKISEKVIDNSVENPRLSRFITVVIGVLLFMIIALLFRLKNLKNQVILKPKKNVPHKIIEEILTEETEVKDSGGNNKVTNKQSLKKIDIVSKTPEDFTSISKPVQIYSFANKVKDASNAADILKVLQEFAYKNLNLQKNMAAVLIAQNIQRQYSIDKYNIVKLAAEIDSVIYANKQVDINELKRSFTEYFEILQQRIKEQSKKKHEVLPKLNPE